MQQSGGLLLAVGRDGGNTTRSVPKYNAETNRHSPPAVLCNPQVSLAVDSLPCVRGGFCVVQPIASIIIKTKGPRRRGEGLICYSMERILAAASSGVVSLFTT